MTFLWKPSLSREAARRTRPVPPHPVERVIAGPRFSPPSPGHQPLCTFGERCHSGLFPELISENHHPCLSTTTCLLRNSEDLRVCWIRGWELNDKCLYFNSFSRRLYRSGSILSLFPPRSKILQNNSLRNPLAPSL